MQGGLLVIHRSAAAANPNATRNATNDRVFSMHAPAPKSPSQGVGVPGPPYTFCVGSRRVPRSHSSSRNATAPPLSSLVLGQKGLDSLPLVFLVGRRRVPRNHSSSRNVTAAQKLGVQNYQ